MGVLGETLYLIMALGYEGYMLLNVDGVNEDMALTTGASVPNSRKRLDSNAGYGGKINTPRAEQGIGFPRTYDWPVFDGSISFELTLGFFNRQVKAWFLDRQKAGRIFLSSRANNQQLFNKCYWSNISINGSSDSAIESTINFTALERNSYIINNSTNNYIDNKIGEDPFGSSPSYNVPTPLGSLLPFINSKVSMNGSNVEFISWEVNYSQDVIKFFSCENNINPIAPKFIGVGPMSVSFSGEYMIADSGLFSIPYTLTSVYITLSNSSPSTQIKLEELELDNASDDIQTGNSLVPISLTYSAYQIAS